MLMPVIGEVFDNIGITKDDVGFICSGSTDYLIGGPFSFVMALDAIGVWPPRSESHVEMDGAWALYEAWVRLQHDDIDAALVYAFGKSSLGQLDKILALQLDPYVMAPLWPDPVSLAALQAQALIDAGGATEAAFAEVAARNRRAGPGQPQGPGGLRPLGRGAAGRGLRGGPAAPARPAADHRRLLRPSCWPPPTRPTSGSSGRPSSPASTTGSRPTRSGARDLTRSPSTARAAAEAGVADRPVQVAEVHAPFASQELIVMDALGLGAGVDVNPSGGALAANPLMSGGLARIGEAAARVMDGSAQRAVAHATAGPVLQQNLVAVLEAG